MKVEGKIYMDYCDSDDERKKNPDAKFWLYTIANGNQEALRFMWTMWNWSHVVDDLVDRDKEVGVENAAKWFIKISEELTFNQFYLQNASSLFPAIMQMFNRWCDGEIWEKSDDPIQRAASHVIKCGDIELYLTVAYLVGGWDHVRYCREARSYDPNGLELAYLD